jgi:sn1-specific diacylglycerol lipase
MATKCSEWTTTYILDSDLVPCLSYDTLENLRDEVLDLIGRLRVSKIEVARRLVRHSGLPGVSEQLEDLGDSTLADMLYSDDQVPSTLYRQQLAAFKNIQEERRRTRGESRSIRLYPPGRIVHLVKTGENRSMMQTVVKCITCFTTNVGFSYSPVWGDNDDFNEIVVTTTMGTDHFPNRLASILSTLSEHFATP